MATVEVKLKDWLEAINGIKIIPDLDENIEQYDPFIINRVLSNDEKMYDFAEKMNNKGYSKLMHFKVMCAAKKLMYPNKNIWFDFKNLKETKVDDKIKMIMEYYSVTEKIAELYLDVLSIPEMTKITAHFERLKQYEEIKKSKLTKKDEND
jgi:hypothetical protein